ncbi:hypothetical protein H6P81_011401 [Aristolochia fimbriata]|uniref:Pectinesterase n=1 Tax=Aristolochia fimbriata TaxID=158543 RepID=A0AAV7EUB5_ARIFI|nr:hypothetical protein H6P81_011401 [Aristolochia fimbriata]
MAARRTIVTSLVIVVSVFGLLLLGFFLGLHVYWRGNSGGDSRPPFPPPPSTPHKGRVVAADVTVAADGSGDFLSVSTALVAASSESSKRPFRIHVKAGVYRENVVVDKADVHLIGDGMGRSVIRSESLKNASAALVVAADGFVCMDLSIENGADELGRAGFAAFVRASYVAFFRPGKLLQLREDDRRLWREPVLPRV